MTTMAGKFNFLNEIMSMDCKVSTVQDVVTSVNCDHLMRSNIDALHELPFIDIQKFRPLGLLSPGFVSYQTKDDEGNTIYHPQWWITKSEEDYYLINNEGYLYARYITKLKNYARPKSSD